MSKRASRKSGNKETVSQGKNWEIRIRLKPDRPLDRKIIAWLKRLPLNSRGVSYTPIVLQVLAEYAEKTEKADRRHHARRGDDHHESGGATDKATEGVGVASASTGGEGEGVASKDQEFQAFVQQLIKDVNRDPH